MIAQGTTLGFRYTIPLLAITGFALGVVYFSSLRRGVHVSVVSHSWVPYVLWALVRITAVALLLTFAVRWGVPALLAALVGFLAARQLAVRGARRLA